MTKYYFDEVNQNELFQTIFNYFRSVNQLSDNHVRFTRLNGELFSEFHIHLNARGQITKADDSKLTLPEQTSLIERIKYNLIDNQMPKIGRYIGFTDIKIDKFYNYKNEFQIIPIGYNFPNSQLKFEEHPFILEFKYQSCPNPDFNKLRRKEKAFGILNILDSITYNRFHGGLNIPELHWNKLFADQSNNNFFIAETCYNLTDFVSEVDEFSNIISLPKVNIITADKYYESIMVRSDYNSQFQFPDNLDSTLDIIFNLDGTEKAKYLKCINWLNQSQWIWSRSLSSSFVCLVTSIESLLDVTTKKCDNCGQLLYSINKNFKAFLNKYSLDIKQFKKIKEVMYRTRSNLAHGSMLLEKDVSPWETMNVNTVNQEKYYRISTFFVRNALYNWLHNLPQEAK